ncbi:MAG: hypothetical protein KAV82_00945 [Phycisphaerae bacterium]|nr:hypothetical protein [Phycisphaerae bacterium]
MNRHGQQMGRIAVWMLILFASWPSADGNFDIDWHTVDGGGDMFSTGGSFELSGTIGQPDAGVISSGTFTLGGGFWFECPPGDCDNDGDVDLDDFVGFQVCFAGPGGGLGPGCDCFDFNADGDVDLVDFAGFQEEFNG